MSHRFTLVTALLLISLPCLTSSALGRDLDVPGDAASLAEALRVAEPGDRILLGPGRHQASRLDLVEGVTIVGDRDDPGSVIIDGGRRQRVFRAEGLEWARLEGLTITGGAAEGGTSYEASGGGIFVSFSRVELEAVHFIGNRAQSAGGCVRVSNGEVEIEDCIFLDGEAAKGGGAIDLSYGSEAEIRQSVFRGNRAAWGGAISARTGSSCWVTDSEFVRNAATAPQELGGAFFADHAAQVAFNGCVLRGNEAGRGGAVRVQGALSTFVSCTFAGNVAREIGGPYMVENGTLFLDHTILAYNEGSAYSGPGVTLIVWATDIYGNLGGDWVGALAPLRDLDDNLELDPLFCSDTDLHLQDDSPCAAENSRVGRIGALGTGCSDVGIYLDRFRGRQENEQVVLTWQVLGAEDHEFRLIAHTDRGEEWSVSYDTDELPGHFRAVDRPSRLAGVVHYNLACREPGAAWSPLGEVSVQLTPSMAPDAVAIESIYPNPFNPQVTIRFTLAEAARVEATIYDIQGRVVFPITAGQRGPGSHLIRWDGIGEHGRQAPTGTYILRIQAGDMVITRKLLMVR